MSRSAAAPQRRVSPVINGGSSAHLDDDWADLDDDGVTDEDLPRDLADHPRVQGGALDLGAYEVR